MPAVTWLRLALLASLAWPFLMAGAAMAGIPALTALVALLPFFGAVCYVVVTFDPVLAPELARNPTVQQSLQTVRMMVLVELCLGAYFTFVPVHTKPFLVIQLALVLVILGLSQAGGIFLKVVPWIAGLIFVGITVSFFWPEAAKELGRRDVAIAASAPPVTTLAVPPLTSEAPALVPREDEVRREDDVRGDTREPLAPGRRPRPESARGGRWLSPGDRLPLGEGGGSATVEFRTLGGEPFVTLRIAPPGASDVISHAVLGGEQFDVPLGRTAVRLQVVTVDWPGQRVMIRLVALPGRAS